ncbi:hypothetical protein RCOM_1165130 [Ricinus communis]|uniref:Uncharacterized protein n=1 Tax=Ricinus communis TaxID=3988 RepID=B9SD90_RICCO|nr:hypothetical protein RCOM_1165130 [Ricinus communis]
MTDDTPNVVKDEVTELASFDPTKMKKKKKKKKMVVMQDEASILNEENVDAGEDLDDHVAEYEDREGLVLQQQLYPWDGSDCDYEYEKA